MALKEGVDKVMWRSFILVGIGILLVAIGCSSSRHDAQAAKAPVRVTAAEVTRSAVSGHEEIMGTIHSRNNAVVQSKVAGKVERIAVTLGSVVEAGQVLAELDNNDLAARVQQTKAASRQANADLARYDSLFARKLVSQQEYDAFKTKADIAAATQTEAEAMLSYTRIEAPFAGRITQKSVDIGDLAAPGKPLFTVEENAAWRFEANVPESRRSWIRLGDTMTIVLDPSGNQIVGKVIEISPSADIDTRSYLTKLEIPRLADARGGQYGRLRVPTSAENNLTIPTEAVIRRGQLEIVYVITTDHRVETRLVRTGRRTGDKTEILAGVSDGERVAVAGAATLSDRDSVEIY